MNENELRKKKETQSCFYMKMGRNDGAEIYELVEIYILTRLATIIKKCDCGLYRDRGLLIIRNGNMQRIGGSSKNIIKIFKTVGFSINKNLIQKLWTS